MECGKLTAKFRDAVLVCFIVNGVEVKRLKNVEIPDEIKKLPFEDYKLDVWENGVITFKIRFKEGVLPDVWPEPRKPKKRGSKAAESAPQEIAYSITGDRRKALVEAVANYTGGKALYQNAPTFAYTIGPFTVDKNGTLSGPIDDTMIRWLANEGFTTKE